jgi:hypothetical protein
VRKPVKKTVATGDTPQLAARSYLKFHNLGFLEYNSDVHVHSSFLTIVLHG